MNSTKARLILCEDCDEQEFFEEVTTAEITGDSRWSKFYEQVLKDTRDGTFWEISWSRGATEYQDQGVENVEVRQVWPKVVQRTIYSTVKPGMKTKTVTCSTWDIQTMRWKTWTEEWPV